MDAKLLSWARAVKARHRARYPVLWLFTDAARMPDPRPAIAALPRGCGVVFRHDAAANRREIARDVAALCRRRGLALTVAGDAVLASALRAGIHLRARERPPRLRRGHLTVSAHHPAELRRAARLGPTLAFLSPVFATASHPGAPGLGPVRFASFARRCGFPVLALGGIDGLRARSLPRRFCAGAGAIAALS